MRYPLFPLTHISCVPVNSYSSSIDDIELNSIQILGWISFAVSYLLDVTTRKDVDSFFVRLFHFLSTISIFLLLRQLLIGSINFAEIWSDALAVNQRVQTWYIIRNYPRFKRSCNKKCGRNVIEGFATITRQRKNIEPMSLKTHQM